MKLNEIVPILEYSKIDKEKAKTLLDKLDLELYTVSHPEECEKASVEIKKLISDMMKNKTPAKLFKRDVREIQSKYSKLGAGDSEPCYAIARFMQKVFDPKDETNLYDYFRY